MSDLFVNIVPTLMLLVFGRLLRQKNFFDAASLRSMNQLISRIFLPCVIFNSIYSMDIRVEHLQVTFGFAIYLMIVFSVNCVVYRCFHLKRPFFIFFSAAFSFGLSGIPLFTTVFGADHMDYLVAMGIGHELFFAVIYLTAAQLIMQSEKISGRSILKNLASPLFMMVLLALVLNLSGLRDLIDRNLVGICVIGFIQKLASVTSVLTMLVIGYRIHFENLSQIRESLGIVVYRYTTILLIGYLFKTFLLDRMIIPTADYSHAYYTMLSLFGSTMLIVLTAQYGSEEDAVLCSNAFVLNVLFSIPIFLLYVLIFA